MAELDKEFASMQVRAEEAEKRAADEAGGQCQMCLEPLREHPCAAYYPCGHVYHVHCAKTWNKNNPTTQMGTCPQCGASTKCLPVAQKDGSSARRAPEEKARCCCSAKPCVRSQPQTQEFQIFD